MKNIVLILLGSTLLLVTACRKVDQELIDKMDAEVTKINQAMPELETGLQRSTELVKKMSEAPNGLKYDKEFNYNEINEMATAINRKYTTVLDISKDATSKLDSLAQNYSSGKIKKEDVEAAFATISASLQGIPQVNARVTPVFDEVSANFAKLMATWEALPAERKAKAEKEAPSPSLSPDQGGLPRPADQGGNIKPGQNSLKQQ